MYGVSKLWIVLILLNWTYAQRHYCREGRYGNNCQNSCSQRCLPLVHPCDARTGRCTEGCFEGYWGDTCDYKCSCLPNVCQQDGGECIGTVTTSQTTTQTLPTTPACVCEGVSAGWRTTAVLFIILFILMVIGLVCMALQLRSLRTFSGKSDKTNVLHHLPCFPYVKNKQSGPSPEENELHQGTNGSTKGEESGTIEEKLLLAGPTRDDATITAPPHHKQPSQIEELNEQIRRLEKEKLEAVKTAEKLKENKVNKNLGFPTDCTMLRLQIKELDKDLFIQCPHVKFDEERVNTRVTQIDDDKVLWNIPDPGNPVDNRRRFQHFCGTSATTPLVKRGFRQYFETVINIQLEQPITEGDTVFELGFCEKDDRDMGQFIQGKKHRYVIGAKYSTKHKKTCLMTIEGSKVEYTDVTVDNIPGSSMSVIIGVYLSRIMRKLLFFDLRRHKLLKKMDTNNVEYLWSMFGLGAQNKAVVSIRLISGSDIVMTEEKRSMINAAG